MCYVSMFCFAMSGERRDHVNFQADFWRDMLITDWYTIYTCYRSARERK